jgi:MarR family transcriptional regulator for hemolysin
MRPRAPRRELAFAIHDVARLIRSAADQAVREYGMTRAQWAVLARLERAEGLKQTDLADMLDLQPITLTRLIDRLCENGLIERRADPDDRRAKRLFLTAQARPLMDRLDVLGAELMGRALVGVTDKSVEQMLEVLGRTRDNLRQAIAAKATAQQEGRRYG